MSRNRMVSKDMWESESLAKLPLEYSAVFIALMNYADDKGRIRYSNRLCYLVFPGREDIDQDFMDTALLRLMEVDCIRFYELDGEWFIHITNFYLYQSISHPSRSRLPEPPYEYELKDADGNKLALPPLPVENQHSMRTPGGLQEDSILKEKKGKEEVLRTSGSTSTSSSFVTGEPAAADGVENTMPEAPRRSVALRLGDLIRGRPPDGGGAL